jgi:putative pyruvate formate lyase activating enzyme
VDRWAGERGYCNGPALPVVSRAAPHHGEEPCISGTRGSGAVFFGGCSLGCVYCQNIEISRGGAGKELTVAQLRDTLLRLRDTGVHNINLVTASHFARCVAEALDGLDLGIPVAWNSSGYESVATLRRLEGLVQVWMPDYKYSLSPAAGQYSAAPDYPEIAAAAIAEMFRQAGPYVMGEDGLLQSGVLVRHLVLPGELENSRGVVDFFARTFAPGEALFSLMSQYTPVAGGPQRPLTATEHRQMREYLEASGIEDGFCQDLAAATQEMIPQFDMTGVRVSGDR